MHRLRLPARRSVGSPSCFTVGCAHAMAQEEEHDLVHTVEAEAKANGATEIDTHCIAIIQEAALLEDCQEAPNPMLPETNEIIWGFIGFAVVFFFVWKMGLPAIKKSMDARTERIRNDLDAAESPAHRGRPCCWPTTGPSSPTPRPSPAGSSKRPGSPPKP